MCCKIISVKGLVNYILNWFSMEFLVLQNLSALVHWYLLNLTKVGSLSLLLRERVFRQMCTLTKFFSEKFAVNSHTFTQKWRRATKESSSCVKKEPIPPDQLALCHTRVIFFWIWHQRTRRRKKSVKQKVLFFLKKLIFFLFVDKDSISKK